MEQLFNQSFDTIRRLLNRTNFQKMEKNNLFFDMFWILNLMKTDIDKEKYQDVYKTILEIEKNIKTSELDDLTVKQIYYELEKLDFLIFSDKLNY